MAKHDSILKIALDPAQLEAAYRRAKQAGFDDVGEWAQALVEADLRRAELESQVTNAIEQGDFQQLAADLRDRVRVAPKPKPKPDES
jgi:hypothetical protein